MATLENKIDVARYAVDMARFDPSIASMLYALTCMEDVLEHVAKEPAVPHVCEAISRQIAEDYQTRPDRLPSGGSRKLQDAARQDAIYTGIMRRVWEIIQASERKAG